MQASAQTLGFAFDRHGLRNELQTATFRVTEQSRVRILLVTMLMVCFMTPECFKEVLQVVGNKVEAAE